MEEIIKTKGPDKTFDMSEITILVMSSRRPNQNKNVHYK